MRMHTGTSRTPPAHTQHTHARTHERVRRRPDPPSAYGWVGGLTPPLASRQGHQNIEGRDTSTGILRSVFMKKLLFDII